MFSNGESQTTLYLVLLDITCSPPQTVVAYSLKVTATVSPEEPPPPVEQLEGTVNPAAPQLAAWNPLLASNAVIAAA